MDWKKILISTVATVTTGALSVAAVSDMCLKTAKYILNVNSVSKFKVVVLSDLHFANFGKDNCRLVNAVKNSEPDIILLAGDFFDTHHGRDNVEKVKKLFSSLAKIAPVYMSIGNHDIRYSVSTGENCVEYAENCGVKVLDGEYDDIVIKGQNVRIGGIFDHSIYLEDYGERWYKSHVYKYLKDFENTESVKLLMMHRPNTFIYTNDKWNIDAVFCGHDHGGIWQIPFIGGVYAPEQGFFPKYDKGEYDFGKMKMFLSAGLEGFYIVPRLFNRPEILEITVI